MKSLFAPQATATLWWGGFDDIKGKQTNLTCNWKQKKLELSLCLNELFKVMKNSHSCFAIELWSREAL